MAVPSEEGSSPSGLFSISPGSLDVLQCAVYPRLTNDCTQAEAGPLPIFVKKEKKKVLLKHNHAHSFTQCVWLLYGGRIEQPLQKLYGLQSQRRLLLPLYIESADRLLGLRKVGKVGNLGVSIAYRLLPRKSWGTC